MPLRAIRLAGVRRFDVVEVPMPIVGPDDVLVSVTAVSICGSDLLGYMGKHQRIKPPTILGHEAAGVVSDVGANVSDVRIGDRVAVDPTSGCGTCRYCRSGRSNLCHAYAVMGEHEAHPGATTGWVVVSATAVHALPDAVPDEIGALVQPLSVALHAVRDQGQVSAGQVVLILGAGPIGLGMLMAARAAGARSIVVEVLDYRLELARRLGADRVIDPTRDDLEALVRETTDGYGVDVAFDAIGGDNDRLVTQAVGLTARGGRIVVAGLKIPVAAIPIGDVKAGEKVVIGSHAHPDSFPEVIRRLASGSYPAAELITHRWPMDRIGDALELLEGRRENVMKVVLLPNA